MRQDFLDKPLRPPLWTKDFVLISIATFMFWAASHTVMPVLPKYALSLGADARLIGLINGFYTAAALAMRPVVGMECDRRGRKLVFVIGLLAILLSAVGYYFAGSVVLLLFLRFLHGMGWSACSTASNTIAADIIPAERKGEGMGYFGIFQTIAQAGAPAVALSLLASFGFGPIFLASISFATLGLIMGGILKTQNELILNKKRVRPAFFEKRALGIAFLMFFLAFTYSGIVSYIALCGEEKGIANMSPFFLAYALGIIASRLGVGKYYDTRGPHLIILWSFILLVLSDLMLAISSSVFAFSIGGAVFGIGYGALQPTLLAMAVRDIEAERRGAVNGTVMGAFDIGVGAGALVLGYAASYMGYSGIYFVSAIAPFLGLLVYIADRLNKSRVKAKG